MVAHMMLESYTRVAIIDTGSYDIAKCEAYVRTVSDFYGLPVHRIRGSLRLLEKLLRGPHDGEFLIVEPGEILEERRFWDLDEKESSPETPPNPLASTSPCSASAGAAG